jgi:E3 ubiquitin-protein ligase RNF144
MDKERAWCPRAGCETICSLNDSGSNGNSPGPVHCPNCSTDFCSLCREPWHNGPCPELPLGIPFNNDHIKCCPMCSVPIEKDEGCAQMMCKRCQHVFCWYCLASLDVSLHSFIYIYIYIYIYLYIYTYSDICTTISFVT